MSHFCLTAAFADWKCNLDTNIFIFIHSYFLLFLYFYFYLFYFLSLFILFFKLIFHFLFFRGAKRPGGSGQAKPWLMNNNP